MANSFQHVAVAAMFLSSVFASGARADQFSLTGAWTLQSMVFVDAETESATNDFGEHPKGYMLYTPNGYMTSLITAEGRQPVPASSDRAAELRSQLLSTMNGLAGPYSFADGKLVIHVEVAHDPRLVGTDSVRFVKIIDNNHVESTTPVTVNAAGKKVKVILTWQRIT